MDGDALDALAVAVLELAVRDARRRGRSRLVQLRRQDARAWLRSRWAELMATGMGLDVDAWHDAVRRMAGE